VPEIDPELAAHVQTLALLSPLFLHHSLRKAKNCKQLCFSSSIHTVYQKFHIFSLKLKRSVSKMPMLITPVDASETNPEEEKTTSGKKQRHRTTSKTDVDNEDEDLDDGQDLDSEAIDGEAEDIDDVQDIDAEDEQVLTENQEVVNDDGTVDSEDED